MYYISYLGFFVPYHYDLLSLWPESYLFLYHSFDCVETVVVRTPWTVSKRKRKGQGNFWVGVKVARFQKYVMFSLREKETNNRSITVSRIGGKLSVLYNASVQFFIILSSQYWYNLARVAINYRSGAKGNRLDEGIKLSGWVWCWGCESWWGSGVLVGEGLMGWGRVVMGDEGR